MPGAGFATARGMQEKTRALQNRFLQYSKAIAQLCESLPRILSAQRFAAQLVDASSSSYANYRSACRARSRREFIAKLGIVQEELDESEGWLTLLRDLGHAGDAVAAPLLRETNELLSIITASLLTAKNRQSNQRSQL